MSDTVLQLVEQFGYIAVAALVLAEGLGLPLPGEASLIFAAAIAGTSERLSLTGVILAATAGAIGGAAGGYWIGASVTDERLYRIAARFGVGRASFERAQQLFRTHGRRTALFGRFLTLLRMVVALLAGGSRMPFGEFMLFSSLGAVIWAAIFGALGYAFGSNLPRLEHLIGRATLVVILALVLVAALLYRNHRRGARPGSA